MIRENIKDAEKLISPIKNLCKIAFVMGSSVYKSNGDVDIDIFLVVEPKNFQALDNYISPLSKSKNHKNNIKYFKEKKINFAGYYLIFHSKEVDLVIMSNDLFNSVTSELSDHYALALKQVVRKHSSKDYFLFGIDGSKLENTYSSYDAKTEMNKFPINLTIDGLYYAFLPLSNILGSCYILTGKREYEESKKRLINKLEEKYKDRSGYSWKNLIV